MEHGPRYRYALESPETQEQTLERLEQNRTRNASMRACGMKS